MSADAEAATGPASEPSGLRVPTSVLATIEATLNRYIALDPEGARGFEPLYGRILAIEIEGLELKLTLIPGPDRIQVFGPYDAEPDCLIRGTPLALARMAAAERKETQLKSGEVKIEGDTALAHELAKVMGRLDPDWEEQLSKLVGDPIAHGVGEGLRSVRDWGRQSAQTLAQDLKDYLEEESRLLPSRYELDAFLSDVDVLRDDLERLDARVARIGQALPAAAPPPKARGETRGGPPRTAKKTVPRRPK